jgi:hypothetical protein
MRLNEGLSRGALLGPELGQGGQTPQRDRLNPGPSICIYAIGGAGPHFAGVHAGATGRTSPEYMLVPLGLHFNLDRCGLSLHAAIGAAASTSDSSPALEYLVARCGRVRVFCWRCPL